MQYTFALAGNQNSGKTTLFNQLTGSSQHVGNWPGVTVEKKTGAMLHHHHGQQTHLGLPRRFRRAHENGQAVPDKYSDVTIVDLPGIYSLSPATSSSRRSPTWSSTSWTPPTWNATST